MGAAKMLGTDKNKSDREELLTVGTYRTTLTLLTVTAGLGLGESLARNGGLLRVRA